MTNAEYILSQMTDYNLSMIFTGMLNYFHHVNGGLGKRVQKAFDKWRYSGDRPIKNYFCKTDAEKDKPSVFAFSRVRINETWGNFSYRTPQVSFQVWLSLQYNPEEWRD